jgi:Predicted Rossmann fold nucleotide-binding protein involved in DNA uptake
METLDKRILAAALELPLEEVLSALERDEAEIRAMPEFNREAFSSIKACWDEYLSFTFYPEPEYPQRLKESANPPYCLIHHGRLEHLRPSVAVIGDWSRQGSVDSPATLLSAELSANGISIVTGMGGGVEYEARYGAIMATAPFYAVAHYPLLNNKRLFKNYLFGGAFISTSHSQARGKHYLLSMLSDALVVFSPGQNERIRYTVMDALDAGRDVFLHKTALDSEEGEKLLFEGVKLIDGASHLLDLYGIESSAPAVMKEGKVKIVKCWR